MRVVLASKDPLTTMQNIRSDKYSIHTLLDVLEMMDVKTTIEMEELERSKREIQLRQQRK